MKFIQAVAAESREANRLGVLNKLYLGDLLQLQLIEFATAAVPNTLTSAARARWCSLSVATGLSRGRWRWAR